MPCRYACSAGRPLPGTRSDTLRAMPTAAGSWQGSGNRSVRAGIIEAGMVTAAVDHSHTVYGRGPDRHGLGVGLTGAAAQPLPAPPDGPRPIESLTSEEHLRTVVARLSQSVELSASAGADSEPLGSVLVFRPWPARSLHVVGESPLAGEFRRLVTAGAVPGWQLHPVPPGRTPLEALAGPLLRRTGSRRFYNILERHGFAYVEDVAATPDECLLELRNSGPRLIAAVRAVISELGPEDDTAGPAGNSGAGPVRGLAATPPALPPDIARAPSGTCSPSPRPQRACHRTSHAAGTASPSSASGHWPAQPNPTGMLRGWPRNYSAKPMSGAG